VTVDVPRPHLTHARPVVAPLSIGRGTRLKILEALALGKPVLSTTLVAEGLPAEHLKNIVLADAPEDFAAQAIRLLNDTNEGCRLGAAGGREGENPFGGGPGARAPLPGDQARMETPRTARVLKTRTPSPLGPPTAS